MQIKAILFDIDGTLVDSNDGHVLAWQEAFTRILKAFNRETIHAQIGKGADMLVPALLPRSDDETRKRVTNAHAEIFKSKYLDDVKPFPGARDLLVHAHGTGRQIVLASSASEEELDHYVDLLDIRGLLSASTSSGDVRHTKPAPDIFSTALAKLPGITADEAVVVGDTPYDMEAAGKCGIAGIGLRSGKFPDAALLQAGALVLYDDVAALLADYVSSPLAR